MFNKQKLANIISIINKAKDRLKPFLKLTVLALLILGLFILSFNLIFFNKIYPGVYIAGNYVGGLTIQKAQKKLANSDTIDNLKLKSSGQEFDIPLETVSYKPDVSTSVNDAYNLHRSGDLIADTVGAVQSIYKKRQLPLKYSLDAEKLSEHINIIETHITTQPQPPTAKLVDGKVVVDSGSAGNRIDTQTLNSLVNWQLSHLDDSEIAIPLVVDDPSLSQNEVSSIVNRLEDIKDKKITLTYNDYQETYEGNDLIELIDIKGGYDTDKLEKVALATSDTIDKEAVNPVFVFEDNKVKQFTPSSEGLSVDQKQLVQLLAEGLASLENKSDELELTIPVKKTPPEYSIEDVNDLGIKELIGRGDSLFKGSIASRVHNISLASSRFNGALVKPGEVFSFNQVLGDVSEYTGYKQAYIIKDGKTVLGDGGGVCQVSTTLFRAVLDAGLEIVERRAHSYRVGYYEQDSSPGFDATVYAPTTDLKVKNDTPGYILIQTKVDLTKRSLVFEIYGTDDGRSVSISEPKVYDVVPPPEDLYVDDPTLPEGEIKQIDWKAWGAKAVFDYLVEKGGNTIHEETFYSNYKPWQSVYLRGTGPAIQ